LLLGYKKGSFISR